MPGDALFRRQTVVEWSPYLDYDALDRIASVAKASGLADQTVTKYTYDLGGNQIRITDALNRVTYFDYDEMGRLTGRVLPGRASLLPSRMTRRVIGRGRLTSRKADNLSVRQPKSSYVNYSGREHR